MSVNAQDIVAAHAQEGLSLRRQFFAANTELIVEIGLKAAVCLAKGNKLLFCGNGGSAADAQHLAAELVNRFQLDRPALPALALTTDTSVLTAIGNDFCFEEVFAKQVRALGRSGDILIGISTSGQSKNVNNALQVAQERQMKVVGLSGKDGGAMTKLCQDLLLVRHESTPLIQEVHIAAGHMICRLVDHFLFESVAELRPYLE